MNIVKPTVNAYFTEDFCGGILLAEYAGRIQDQTQSQSAPGTAIPYILEQIESGNLDILKHCPLYIYGKYTDFSNVIKNVYCLNSVVHKHVFNAEAKDDKHTYIYATIFDLFKFDRVLAIGLIMNNNAEAVNDILAPHGVQLFKCDKHDVNAFWHIHAITQYSTAMEFAIDDTIICAIEQISKVEYKDGLKFCIPYWIKHDIFNNVFRGFLKDYKTKLKELYDEEPDISVRHKLMLDIICDTYNSLTDSPYNIDNRKALVFIHNCIDAERVYMNCFKVFNDATPRMAKDFLNNMVKADLFFTGRLKDLTNNCIYQCDDVIDDDYSSNMEIIRKAATEHIDCIKNSRNDTDESKE